MTGMIVDLIDFLINLCSTHLPEYHFSADTTNQISSSITTVAKFLTDVNFILPLGDIITGMVLAVGLRIFKFTLFAGNWIIRRIFDVIP